jgi:hypothetical protein
MYGHTYDSTELAVKMLGFISARYGHTEKCNDSIMPCAKEKDTFAKCKLQEYRFPM